MAKSTKKKEPMSAEDARDKFFQLRDQYKNESQKRGINSLWYGDFGTGKTWALHTCPKPVFIHSFDPGGSVTLRPWIETGEVIVESFETEDASDPRAYRDWEKRFDEMRQSGIFEHIGTYAIDSLTTLSESLMNAAMKGNKDQKPRNSEIGTYIPQLQDYQVQQYTIRDFLNLMCGLPCHFVCTGHVQRDKDEVTGSVIASPMITGKLAQKIPLLFDEVYVTNYKTKSSSTEYYFLTESQGVYKARSRLASSNDLKRKEVQDFSAILDKCNYEYEDKPLFLESEAQEQTT